jgi:Domain of unknown function (DUF4159)
MTRAACRIAVVLANAALVACIVQQLATRARALGVATDVSLAVVRYEGSAASVHPTAMKRLAWEVRQRTSVATNLEPPQVRFSDPRAFESPFLYWTGAGAFPPLSEQETQGLRRFVELGGFVLIDDAEPSDAGFDASVRRELARAFGTKALAKLPSTHVVFRSFYLVQHPAGRFAEPGHIEGIERAGRVAVVYTRHALGGALERDNVGNYAHPMDARARELAFRLGVNFVMYALCLDYKDDQVHAPFILRRWAGAP